MRMNDENIIKKNKHRELLNLFTLHFTYIPYIKLFGGTQEKQKMYEQEMAVSSFFQT